MSIVYTKYDGTVRRSPKNNIVWSSSYKEAIVDGKKIINNDYDESFAIRLDFQKVIASIEKKTRTLTLRGYEHTDGNIYKMGEDGAAYWSSALNYFSMTDAPYRVVTLNGKVVTYTTLDAIKNIYKTGYEKALEIQKKDRELKQRVLKCTKYSELKIIIGENKER